MTAERNHLTGIVSDHKLWLAKSRVGEEGPLGNFELRTMMLGHDEDGDRLTSCYIQPLHEIKTNSDDIKNKEVEILKIIKSGEYRHHHNSPEWAGYAIAHLFGINSGTNSGRKIIYAILQNLISEKKLKIIEKASRQRKPQKFYAVVESVSD